MTEWKISLADHIYTSPRSCVNNPSQCDKLPFLFPVICFVRIYSFYGYVMLLLPVSVQSKL